MRRLHPEADEMAYLFWKDGRRETVPFKGSQRIYVRDEANQTDTIFDADAELLGGCVIYRETATIPITPMMRVESLRIVEDLRAKYRWDKRLMARLKELFS